MTVKRFLESQDYIDICYMIDHVPKLSTRIDVLEKLGYKIGVNIVKNDLGVKTIEKGKKKGEIRIQVTPKYKGVGLANCVVIS